MANHVYRFALGRAGEPRSGLWRAWTHEDEVHLAVRTTHDEVSLSAWPTGRWRITAAGHASRWTRPKEFRPGWTRGPDLLIPHSPAPIRWPGDDPHPTEPITWLPAPAPGCLARITLLFASSRAEASIWRPPDAPGTETLTILPMRTAGKLHLIRLDEPLDPADLPAAVPDTGTPSVTGFLVIVGADQAGRPSLRESHEGS